METLISTSKSMPVGGIALVDKKKVMELVDQLRLAIPQEMKAAGEVLAQKDQIINSATLDARRTKTKAEEDLREKLSQNEIHQKAEEQYVRAYLARTDFTSLREEALHLVEDQKSSLEEVLRVTTSDKSAPEPDGGQRIEGQIDPTNGEEA